jgi:hypothetical protein
MTSFQTLQTSGLPYGWTTLLTGWEEGYVSTPELQSYASNLLALCAEKDLSLVLSLADTDPTNTREVGRLLRELAVAEPVSRGTALRTWDVALLRALLAERKDEPSSQTEIIDLLMELTAFWAERGYPPYSPHTVQGRGNDISPTEYYTAENCRQILQAHRQWMAGEEAAIRVRY